MSDEERDRRVSGLFDLLERKLVVTSGPTDIPVERTYVLAPDPPPFNFDGLVGNADIHRISWGIKDRGRAAATDEAQAFQAIAPNMLDLWADPLYILVFAARLPDDRTCGRWIEEALKIESDATPKDTMQTSPLPPYALMVFDCGDLVGEPPTDN